MFSNKLDMFNMRPSYRASMPGPDIEEAVLEDDLTVQQVQWAYL